MKVEYIVTKSINGKDNDGFCESVECFNNFLKSNKNVVIKNNKMIVNECKSNYDIQEIKSDLGKEKIFHITIYNDENYEEDEKVKIMEKITKEFRKCIRVQGNKLNINTIWNEISFFYCKNSYPKVNELENLMRKLIVEFMIRKVGVNWILTEIPHEFQKHLSNKSKGKNGENKKNLENFIEDGVYEADFIQLKNFLFDKYSKNKFDAKLFEQLENIKECKDYKEEIDKIILRFKPKSNWDKYFSQISSLKNEDKKSLEKDWKRLYDLRNKIAHNKLFNKGDYENLNKLYEKLKRKLEDAISGIEEIKVNEEEKEMITNSSYQTLIKNYLNCYKIPSRDENIEQHKINLIKYDMILKVLKSVYDSINTDKNEDIDDEDIDDEDIDDEDIDDEDIDDE